MPGDPINGDKSIRVTVVNDNVHRHFRVVIIPINQEMERCRWFYGRFDNLRLRQSLNTIMTMKTNL